MTPRQKFAQLKDPAFITATIIRCVSHSMALEDQPVSSEKLQEFVGGLVKSKLNAAVERK